MRISKEETAANRAKVLAAAARLFREKGVDGIAVAELMQAAGLTHGGFYNHFESKEELAAAVSRVERQAAEADKRGREAVFAHYVGRYLAPDTRDTPGTSCPMATLGTDAARHGSQLRDAFAEGVRHYIEAFAKIMPGDASEQRTEAITVLSTLIGALTLSRACVGADDALADEVIATVRDQLLGQDQSPRSRRGSRRA